MNPRSVHRSLRSLVIPVILLLVVSGCRSEDDPPVMSGVWSGAQGEWSVHLTVLEVSERITGAGSLREDTAAYSVTVSNGLHVNPHVTLTLTPSGREAVSFQGRFVNDNTVEGVLDGWRFRNVPITLERE